MRTAEAGQSDLASIRRPARPKIRCAIYTRKSSDEGLDQAFNSLDAQYEACSAYIASQKAEGWRLITQKRYDDGGLSGGTLERPALQDLLADIEAGLVDMVVLYKIDRLTRSLSDFARIVDRLDASGASFVSVTQSFNTATSMGRLTLNMLLSFAQFEREVTAERIRDKIAASKQKGFWMGGVVPLGYDRHPDKAKQTLVVNQGEAETVRTIYALYDQLGCLAKLKTEVDRQDLRAKTRNENKGAPFSRGALHKLLTNPLYRGKIVHKEKLYDGLHEAIIDDELWRRVQVKLQAASAKRRGTIQTKDTKAWLKGKLFDEAGDHLTPSHTRKKGRILRYYISNRLIKASDPSAWRLPAKEIEQTVETLMLDHLDSIVASRPLNGNHAIYEIKARQKTFESWKKRIAAHDTDALLQLRTLPLRIDLKQGAVSISLDPNALAVILNLPDDTLANTMLHFDAPCTLKRRGIEARMICGTRKPDPDRTLQLALAKAHLWYRDIKTGKSLHQIAKACKSSESHIRTRLALATLSPKIQAAILNGTQPADLTIKRLTKTNMPQDWTEQEKLLGVS